MSSKDSLTILHALENLNILVDAETLDEIEVTEKAQLVSHKEEEPSEREIYWVSASRDDQTAEAIRATFRTVLHYLQSSYKKMKESGDPQRLVEGINTIMVLVGEATRKIEKFNALFKERVTDFEEYKELQHFYRDRVIRESFKEFAKVPIPIGALEEKKTPSEEEVWEQEIEQLINQQETEEGEEGIHLLNDVEVIKRDHLYELFYIKSESGHPFYTYQLVRNMKVACDFGEYAQEYFGDDPLLQIKNWEDKSLHLLAKRIQSSSKKWIEKFYKEALKYKEMDLVMSVHYALMALMLAADPRNLIRQFSLKGCHRYFADFKFFLREALLNREYQKFLLYSPPASQPFFIDLMELVQSLCFHLFTLGADQLELKMALTELVERHGGIDEKMPLTEQLKTADEALTETLKKHPNGPLFKALDLILEDEERLFDPYMSGNMTTYEVNIQLNEHSIHLMRFPCPIIQEFINQAFITEEFKTYLTGCLSRHEKVHHLIINFQDRTSWKEHARSAAIEGLGRKAEFAQVLTVVTLAKDTDFYNQMGPYHDLNEAREFIHHFREHLDDEITGYAFPIGLKKALFPHFIDSLLATIHQTFFDNKMTFSLRDRLDFIELTYQFVILKLIEIVNPTHLSLISKDSLDIGGTTAAGLIAILSCPKGKIWKKVEIEKFYTLLFGPTLLNRERAVHPERFERLHEMVRLLEQKGNFLPAFESLYEQATLHASPQFI